MTTKTADLEKSTERLRKNATTIVCALVVSAALCSGTMAGRIVVEGDNNVVHAQELNEVIECAEDGNELSLNKTEISIVEVPTTQIGASLIGGVEPEQSSVTAGAIQAHADALSVAVIETKNDASIGTLGNEGVLDVTGTNATSVLETEDGVEENVEDEMEEVHFDFVNTGYVTALSGVNVRVAPNIESEILANKGFGTQVEYATTAIDGWYAINLGDREYGYASSEFISDEEITGAATSYACSGDTRKLYMSYRCIGAGRQLKLQKGAATADNGVRTYHGRYLIAIGQSYGASVGTYLDVVLNDGTTLECIVGDAKDPIETQGGAGYIGIGGDITEWIVDPSALPQSVRTSGDVSSISGWGARVSKLVIYPDNVFSE